MPVNIHGGFPPTTHVPTGTAASTPQPSPTQASEGRPAKPDNAARKKVMYRSEEIAKIRLGCGPSKQPTLRKDRPSLPALTTYSPDTPEGLQIIASHALALLELWEHQIKELPLHLETHEAHSAPNEKILRSCFADLEEAHADFVEHFQMQMSTKLINLGYGREEIATMVALMLERSRPPNHESSHSKQSSASLKHLCEQLRHGIDDHLQEVKQNGAELNTAFLKEQYKQLLAVRRDYRCALGYSTAISMRSASSLETSTGPALHGATRARELNQFYAEGRRRADDLRKDWKSAVAAEAIARRNGARADRADRPAIPAILSIEHELSINTGRFSAPRTPEELGIANIVTRFFPQTLGKVPAFDPQAPLIPRGRPFKLTGPKDVARLASELAASTAPFHVLCIPGTNDGSFERSLVFQNAGPRDFPKWQLLPRTGNPVDKDVPSFGLARNTGQKAPSDVSGADIPRPGTPFPSADENREQLFLNRFTEDLEHNKELLRMGSNHGGKITKPTQKDILHKILEAHVESVKSTGGSHAPVTIMSPLTTKAKMHHALARHLGYELDFDLVDCTSLSATLRKAGCELDEDLLVEDEAQSLMDGFYDKAPCGTALHLVLADKSTCTFVWNKEQRNKALVHVNDDMGTFANLGLQNNQMLKMTPSAVWKQLEGNLPGVRASKFTIEASSEGKLAALLTEDTDEKAHLKLMNAAREEDIPIEKLSSFQVFSYVFIKQNPDAIATTYRLNDADDGGNVKRLGELLDNTPESFMVVFEELNHDDELERRQVFFQAPGQFADKDQIVGETCSQGHTSFQGPPSLLLQTLADEAREDGTRAAIISVLSTGRLAEDDIEFDVIPEHVHNALTGMMHAGLPVIAEDETDQLGFIECLHERNGGIPSEITGQMIAAFTATGRLSEDDPIETSFRLSAVPPLNAGADLKGTFIRVPTATGMRNITFHEDETGSSFFIDLFGKKHPAGDLELCALSQGWHARGAVEILQFKGDNVQTYDLLQDPEEQMKIDAAESPEKQAASDPVGVRNANSGRKASGKGSADWDADTDWEDAMDMGTRLPGA